MKIKHLIARFFISGVLLCTSLQCHAGAPVWTIIPLTSSTISVPGNGTAKIIYTITNQSNTTHTLALNHLPSGISQNTSTGNCTNPLVLGYKQSCILALDVDGSLIPKSVAGGPSLCQIGTNGAPNPHLCYQPSQANSLNITRTAPQYRYAYVPMGFLGLIDVCSLNSDGTFNICSLATPDGAPSWMPSAIAFTMVSGVEYGYVSTGSTGIVYQCVVNMDGTLSTCNQLVPTGGIPYTEAQGVNFATVNGTQYAYVSTNNTNTVSYCTLLPDGTFDTCNPTPTVGAPPSWRPISVAFTYVNDIQYAYVADAEGNVFQCTLNNDGTFDVCGVTPTSGAPAWGPFSVAFATVNAAQYAYVTDYFGNLFYCTLNLDGSFNVCNATPTTGAPAWSPITVDVQTFSGTQYVYVASSDIYQCTIFPTGALDTCSITPITMPSPWLPFWVAFATVAGV